MTWWSKFTLLLAMGLRIYWVLEIYFFSISFDNKNSWLNPSLNLLTYCDSDSKSFGCYFGDGLKKDLLFICLFFQDLFTSASLTIIELFFICVLLSLKSYIIFYFSSLNSRLSTLLSICNKMSLKLAFLDTMSLIPCS